jgi:site-specific DNA-methyltransferase (adenine-specific)
MLNQTHHGDCLELVEKLEDNSLDLLITSPPYYNAQHKYQRGSGFHYTTDIGEPLYVIEDFFEKVRPKLKPDAMVCLNLAFSYGETGVMRPYDILNRLRKQGYFVIDQIIWWKNNPIPIQKRLTNAYELIFVLSKSPKGTYYTTEYTHNVWKFPVQKGVGHSAVFPDELPRMCLEHFSKEGDVVLDPFMGSGTTARACIQMKRNWIGFELNKDYAELSP